MRTTSAERQALYVKRLKERANLTPALARAWAVDLLNAWDEIAPGKTPRRKTFSKTFSVPAALLALNELSRPDLAITEQQRSAMEKIRLLIDAVTLRDIIE